MQGSDCHSGVLLLRDVTPRWSVGDVLSSAGTGACHQPHHVAVIVDADEGRGQPCCVNQRALIRIGFN